jgi:hypothetical protein
MLKYPEQVSGQHDDFGVFSSIPSNVATAFF